MSGLHHLKFIVTGKVQGVFFRVHTVEKAQSLGLSGFIKNHRDGRVSGEAIGQKEQVEIFKDWLRNTGSPGSVIEDLSSDVQEVEVDTFNGKFTKVKGMH
ncbi:hypothetical protein FRC03_000308 [Tulasnella sp. 419]|nr:hypothetical protein FRC03_000308 [Tulasnella sp. 419]